MECFMRRAKDIIYWIKWFIAYIAIRFNNAFHKRRFNLYDIYALGDPVKLGFIVPQLEKNLESPFPESHLEETGFGPTVYSIPSMGHFLKSRIYYDVTGLRYIVQPCLLFTTPVFFVTLSSLVPTFFSPVVARSSSLYRLSFDLLPGAGSCSLQTISRKDTSADRVFFRLLHHITSGQGHRIVLVCHEFESQCHLRPSI
ncbi:uncharacterized protein TNCV_1071051 [Trichonephila clavipes]|nr:uncharacterized protein TNCV_1071051 [Trichonephila clavipes]